ncbi:MAG TPA: biosynthetic peptidoglycan transglycosylase [Longimicrobiales bacterium]|nr:biosynthetic peptidoglycan transglycosylase [Longimicrobiales bacterium]
MMRVLVALPLSFVGAAWFLFLSVPWPVSLASREPERTAFMNYRLREAARLGETLEIRHQWVPLDSISPNLRRAVLVAEDDRFYQHQGVDWQAIREEVAYTGDDSFSWRSLDDWAAVLAAARYVLDNRDEIRGRSTITQQVAKNLYFTPERSLVRKLEEFVVARRLERFLDKDRILEIYLNIAEWGPGIFGAEAAARHYFDRSAADLTRAQAAALAATLPQPLVANPAHQPNRIAWRQELILNRMGGSGPPVPPPVELAPLPPEMVEVVPVQPEVVVDPLPAELAVDSAPAGSTADPVAAADTEPATAPPDTSAVVPADSL